jgi:hypothetical protein
MGLDVQGYKKVVESLPQRPGHVLGPYRVLQLLLVNMFAESVGCTVVGLETECSVQRQSVSVESIN